MTVSGAPFITSDAKTTIYAVVALDALRISQSVLPPTSTPSFRQSRRLCTSSTTSLPITPVDERALTISSVTNWSNSPTSSAVASWIPEELVIAEPLAKTSAVRLALGIGIEARSCVRFWRSCCWVEFKLFEERPSMRESRSEVLMFGSLYARP